MNKIIIRKDFCKGCGLCVDACPQKILKISSTDLNIKGYHPVEVTDQDKCLACAMCAIMCPDVVIKVEKEL